MNEFFSWESLGTYAGSTAATALIVQWIKGFVPWPTQLLSYLVAVALLTLATLATGHGGEGWTVWALIPLNAIVVSLAANGGYTVVQRATNNKLK